MEKDGGCSHDGARSGAPPVASSDGVVRTSTGKEVPALLDEVASNELQLRPVQPVDVLVRNLRVELDLKPRGLAGLSTLFRKKPAGSLEARSKIILDKVNAYMPAGSITAIIGASGSGKTSFLNVLSRRMNDSRLSDTGEILYNSNSDLASVRTAYVMQQDILLPTLTVRETLHYAAELRLPSSTTADERHAVVEEVILELGLKECADTRIGDDTRRGCSGGEKRRTSLGVQLLVNPSILFLDEVTTGLDAASAFQLARTLKQLAKRGRTIIATLHQPRSEIWGLFDRAVLLAGGSPICSGPTELCLEHLTKIGYPLPPFVNPAEHLIDLAAVDYRTSELEAASKFRVEQLKKAWSDVPEQEPATVKLAPKPSGRSETSQQTSSFFRQVKVQTARTFKTTWRDPLGVTGSMFECFSMAIVTGWIFLNLDGSQSGIRSREGALYIAVALQGYLILLFETYRLTLDIGVFDRERAEGVVDVSSFLISRRLARFLLEDLPVPFIYSVVFYFMAGFRREVDQFFIFFGFILLCQFASVSFATICVAISRDFAGASLIANLNFTLQSLCSGFFVQSNQIPVYVRWVKWTVYVWYANGALITNEFVGSSTDPAGYLYDCPYPGGTSNPACAPWTGRFIVRLLGYPQDNWIWRPAVIIIGFICLFSVGAGMILAFFKAEMRIAQPKPTKQELSPVNDTATAAAMDRNRSLKVTLEGFGLQIDRRNLLGQTKRKITILDPLNVEFTPGILNVIMGVSGGGKTSLLNLMANRLSSTLTTRYRPSGTMLLGGSIPSKDVVRSITSYVCQSDDALLPTLTVREMLYFAAQLRLPEWMSSNDKAKRAEEVLLKLGLRECADNMIGNNQVKGISGGEKRRVSIAIQILTDPKILFLDEPTSGLDAFTASSILTVLQNLAEEGRTIILTIHQSRSDVFQHFGSVLLLARGGHAVYAGPGKDMLPYLSSLGHPCPDNVNPADFALDLISVDLQSSRQETSTRKTVNGLIASWKNSPSQDPERSASQTPVSLPASLGSFRRQRVSIFRATRLLLHRSALSFSRSPPAILARTSQVLSFAIIVTLFFAPLKHDYAGVQSHVGFIQEVLGVYFVGMLHNVAVYPDEKAVFYNENDDRVYSVEPFFISYTILELPFEIITSALFSILSTFAVGLPRTGTVFGVIAYVCFSLVNCGESIGIIFNTLFNSTGFAVSLISVVLSLGLIMSGVLATHVPAFLDAFNHLSPGKWSIAAMAPYLLLGVDFTCAEYEKVGGRCPIENGREVLELYNLPTDGGLALVWLTIVVIGYRALAYVVLKIAKREWTLSGILERKKKKDKS